MTNLMNSFVVLRVSHRGIPRRCHWAMPPTTEESKSYFGYRTELEKSRRTMIDFPKIKDCPPPLERFINQPLLNHHTLSVLLKFHMKCYISINYSRRSYQQMLTFINNYVYKQLHKLYIYSYFIQWSCKHKNSYSVEHIMGAAQGSIRRGPWTVHRLWYIKDVPHTHEMQSAEPCLL